ncbi:glycosyltransferase family 61 protein [Candidatus Pelagibacter communis]|uniref:glycosyltransferase family 61 protein n=1 Tax=Candidatus Pelagibacter TaxID=198251 RepID=UPI003EE35607
MILKKISKKIFHNIFYLIYGKVKVNEKKNKEYFEKKRVIISSNKKKFTYNIFKCKNSRLYTDRIQDTAIIYKNTILNEPSFQLRKNDLDRNIKKNIVLDIGTPRIQKKLNGNVMSLLTGGGGNNNYFHWLFDVLPRIALMKKFYKLQNINFFLCPDVNKWQLRTLELLGIKTHKCISSINYRHIKAKNIISTTHPWIINNVHKDIENLPRWISMWLKSNFLKHKSKKNFPKKVYIDRSDSESNLNKYRGIKNEKELIHFLKKKKFFSVKLSELSIEEQIKLFNDAQIVIGLHGAGLANLIWCNKYTKIIELKSKNTNRIYENLARVNGIKYISLSSKPVDDPIYKHYGIINVNIKKLSTYL